MLLLSPVCGMTSAGIETVSVWPHSVQVSIFSPFSSVVGSLVTLPSSQLWSCGAMTVTSLTASQSAQWIDLLPLSVQVSVLSTLKSLSHA